VKAPVISELDTTELAKLLGDDLAQIEFRSGRVAELLAELNRRLSGGAVAGSSPATNGSGGAVPPAAHGRHGKRHVFRSDEEKASIIEYSLHHPIAETAKHFGVPEASIYVWRSKLGISKNYTPPAPAPVRQRRPFDPEAARMAAADSAFPDSVQKGDSRRIA
jgi:transposase-like protein